ncbi:MAG TPA: SpoIIE family protein phosphatase [Thermoanaerobaculia bacterium]
MVVIVLADRIDPVLDRFGREFPPLTIVSFFAWVAFILITIYLIAISIRYVLRSLFWRVGRRLLLSYLLIGGLPFVFFGILLIIAGYLSAGVLSQAAFRSERAATLTRLDQANLEYALTHQRPAGALPTLEIYDSQENEDEKLPDWLTGGSFLGLVRRGGQPLFVSAHAYEGEESDRNVVFVQPVDDSWREALLRANGLFTVHSLARTSREGPASGVVISNKNEGYHVNIDEDPVGEFFRKAIRRNGVIWGDFSPPLVDWETGEPQSDQRLFTLFSNPWRNLINFYFIEMKYWEVFLFTILGFASLLAVMYLLAAMLAAGLIFSISRAINRIEKGTKAVEKGDFSYRIKMKPHNQLGEVAQSFDRMTESLGSLLRRAAQQERLQSEIDIAATIQRNMLPKDGPHLRGVSFSAHFEPTASIGGDYYDVFSLDKTRLAVAIGDVSGHGLSTGLVMAMVKAALTTLVEEGSDEYSIFKRLNDLVVRSTEKRAFMTLAFTIFDMEKGTIRHTNAGHLYPYLLRAGSAPRAIEGPSLPLGIRPTIEPKTIEVALRESDTLVYLSDGIVEAQDENGNPFGFDHLEQILNDAVEESPASIQEQILAAVSLHSGKRAADDDRTVMILRFDQIAATGHDLLPLSEELAPAYDGG